MRAILAILILLLLVVSASCQQAARKAAEGAAFHVMLHTSATAADVAGFYAEKAKAAGFSQMNKTETPDGFTLYYDSAARGFVVTAMATDDGCDVSLQLVPK